MSSKCNESFYDCLGGKHRSGYADVTFTLPGKDPETWRLVTETAPMRDQKSVADLRKLIKEHGELSFSLDFQGVALPFDPVHCQGRKYRDSFDPVKAKEVLGNRYLSWLSTTVYSLPLFPKESVKYSKKVATEFLKESTVVGVVDHVRKYPGILAIGPKALIEDHAYGNLGVLDSVVTEMASKVDGTSRDFKKSLEQFMEYYTYASTEHGAPNAEAVLALGVKLGFVHLVDPASALAAKEKNRRDVLKLLGVPMEDIQKKRLHRAHSLLEKYTYAVVAAGEKGMSIDDVDAIVKGMLADNDPAAGTGQWATEDRIRRDAEDSFRRLVVRGRSMVDDARKNIIDAQTSLAHFEDYATCRNLQSQDEDRYVSVKDMVYDDLYVVHETAYTVEQDEDGNYVLYPHGDKTGSNRETIHFGVNHKVLGHMERSGSKSQFAVVANMKKVVDMNPGCVDAIHEVDTILTPPTGRGLKLPQDCVIVKYTPLEVTAESRNDAVERALAKAGSRFSFCGKGSTDCVAVDGVSESLKAIAVGQGVLYSHATNHPMYHHELRTSSGTWPQNEAPVVIASTATKDPDGSIGCRVSADMVARLSPNGRARLFTQDAWLRSTKPPLPAYVPTDPKEELVEMWRQFAKLGNDVERPELCKQLMSSGSQNFDTPPDASLFTQYVFKETLLQTRGSRIAPEGINAQASCEQRAAVVRDTLVARHGLVRCATETRIQPEYSVLNSERAGLPTYRETVTDNGTSRTPLAVFTLVGVTASGEVVSYTSCDSTALTPSSAGLFNADDDLNLTRHPSVVDALRGTGIKSEGHEALVPTMAALLDVIKKNSEAHHADMLPQQRLIAAENLTQHVANYDHMVLTGGDSSYMREARGRLLASMPESMSGRLAID